MSGDQLRHHIHTHPCYALLTAFNAQCHWYDLFYWNFLLRKTMTTDIRSMQNKIDILNLWLFQWYILDNIINAKNGFSSLLLLPSSVLASAQLDWVSFILTVAYICCTTDSICCATNSICCTTNSICCATNSICCTTRSICCTTKINLEKFILHCPTSILAGAASTQERFFFSHLFCTQFWLN